MAIKRLVEVKRITGHIEVLSGLHIGAGSEEIHIGGMDSPVVRDPVSGHPYIPGSSLKGKIRSLLELATGHIDPKGGPYSTDQGSNPIARIFGNGKVVDAYDGGPTRVTFADCRMNNAQEMIDHDALTEAKYEVSMDRLKGTVGGGGPRQMERVPRGARFDVHISYKVFDVDGDEGDADRENLELLLIGMKLLENDALGGSGSRGYGRVRFDLSEGREEFETTSIESDLPRFMNKGN